MARNMKEKKWTIFATRKKCYIAEKLSKFFNIPHFKIKDILEWGKTFTDELGEEIKAKVYYFSLKKQNIENCIYLENIFLLYLQNFYICI